MTTVSTDLSIYRIPDGISYARVPADFPARCKAVGLRMQEQSVLIVLMTYQVVAPDGSILLKAGTSKMIAANCGMSAANVRRAISGLREKGVLGRTDLPHVHRLTLSLWDSGDSREKHFVLTEDGSCVSPEKQAMYPTGSSGASVGKRGCFPGDTTLKKPEMVKKVPKKSGACRVSYS